MKKADIQIGGVYYTVVSGVKVKVRVKGLQPATRPGQRVKFYVARMDNGRDLQPRDASALHTKEDVLNNMLRHHVGTC